MLYILGNASVGNIKISIPEWMTFPEFYVALDSLLSHGLIEKTGACTFRLKGLGNFFTSETSYARQKRKERALAKSVNDGGDTSNEI